MTCPRPNTDPDVTPSGSQRPRTGAGRQGHAKRPAQPSWQVKGGLAANRGRGYGQTSL